VWKNPASSIDAVVSKFGVLPTLFCVLPVHLSRVAAKTCAALFYAVFSPYCVLFGSLVTATPMGRCGPFGVLDVLPMRDSFKMIWVDAGPDLAKMVDLQALQNRPMADLVRDAVSWPQFTLEKNSPVTSSISIPSEQPASRCALADFSIESGFHRRTVPATLMEFCATTAAESTLQAAARLKGLLALEARFRLENALSRLRVPMPQRTTSAAEDSLVAVRFELSQAPRTGFVVHRHLRVTSEFSQGEAGFGVAGVRPGHDSRVLSPVAVYALSS
jgi:hypothetical protein